MIVTRSAELLRLAKKLNFNSAPGLDGIPAIFTKQLLQYEPLRELVVVVFNTFLRLGSVPTDWTTGLWKAIPKFGDARKFDVKQQRPISIMSTVEKIFEALLNITVSPLGCNERSFWCPLNLVFGTAQEFYTTISL
jgi:hypothetical protein